MNQRHYDAVLVQDGQTAKPLVMFAAPAIEINQWVGVPQRLMLGADETVGFQRTVSDQRLAALAQFFADPQNIIQNPLLGAIRQKLGVDVTFTATDPANPHLGTLTICWPDDDAKPLKALFTEAREALEARDLSLKGRIFPEAIFLDLQRRARDAAMSLDATWEPDPRIVDIEDEPDDDYSDDETNAAEHDLDDRTVSESEADASVDLATAVEDELDQTHITDFWDQLRAREKLLEILGVDSPTDGLFGFTREVLGSYLKPVILVDGQHRLAGAVEAARRKVEAESAFNARAAAMIEAGATADEVSLELMTEASRRLPMSLTLNDAAEEHVFQFVVVNQRATPVAKALLGTIVSTSLSTEELARIRDRLTQADVPVEGSQVVAALARNATSPFAGKVARGFDPDNTSKLPWSVVGSLAEMFRTLKGGAFYHQSKPDYAASWAKIYLPESAMVEAWSSRGFRSELEYWRQAVGPWQPMFIAFWTAVRARLASDDPEDGNYWGNPRSSNLFNKPSLTILQVDFFAYLSNAQVTLNSEDDVKEQVEKWLRRIDPKYFARDWKLAGVKKDAVSTRRKWSELWFTYRQAPSSLPDVREFRTPQKR